MGDLAGELRRHAPAAQRNLEPIAAVLREWLPERGDVLEIASGTGEHALALARYFPQLNWQPSDSDPLALSSIAAWGSEGPANLKPPVALDAASTTWPVAKADAILNVNMVHISPLAAALGLLDGAGALLPKGAPLILYGPWLEKGITPAASNLSFDRSLKDRDPRWGLRTVEWFAEEAARRGFDLVERRSMPANNLMLLFRRGD
jgi:hypothetical protein